MKQPAIAPPWLLIYRPERLTASLATCRHHPAPISQPCAREARSSSPALSLLSPLALSGNMSMPLQLQHTHPPQLSPCIQPISMTTGSGSPLLMVGDHTDLSMPDSGLPTTYRPYDSGITVTWRLNQRHVVQAAPDLRSSLPVVTFFGWGIFARNGQPHDCDSFHHPSSAIIAVLIYQK